MRVTAILLASIVLIATASLGQTSQPQPAAAGFTIDNIDKATDPCVDFYQYACGNWMKKAEIPADRPGWASFNEVDERNLVTLRGILEKAAAASGFSPRFGKSPPSTFSRTSASGRTPAWRSRIATKYS